MIRRITIMPFFLLLFFFVAGGKANAQQHVKTYSASSFNVSAQVTSANVLHVTEKVVFHFSGGSFSFVTRELPTDNSDGITLVSVSMDQQAMSEGSNPGEYEVDYGNPVKITWHFSADAESDHTFTLVYDIAGIVQKHAQQDLIDWKPLPTQHSYTISAATITLDYPANAQLVQAPEVDQGQARVSTAADQVRYQAGELGQDEALELGLRFRPGLVAEEPRWQLFAELTPKLLPFTILFGLLIAIFGCLLPFRSTRRYKYVQPDPLRLAALGVTTPPGDLPPAIAGVLVESESADPEWDQVLAAIFHLMDRGLIAIAPPSMGGWLLGSSDFNLVLVNLANDVRPHEAVLLSIFFQNQSGDLSPLVSLKKAGELYRKNTQVFQKALLGEMTMMGMIDLQRQGIRRRLGRSSGLMIVFSILFGGLLLLLAPWPLIFLPIGFFIAGIGVAIARGSVSLYTGGAREAALPWKAFAEYMRLISAGQGALGAELFASYLAYATSFGLLNDWATRMHHSGLLALPPWFRELVTAGYIQNQQQAYREFHRMSTDATQAGVVSSNDSGGNSGGSSMSGSSGAAGGGSSSAG